MPLLSSDTEDEDADANMDDVDKEGDIDDTVGSASEGRDPDVSTWEPHSQILKKEKEREYSPTISPVNKQTPHATKPPPQLDGVSVDSQLHKERIHTRS